MFDFKFRETLNKILSKFKVNSKSHKIEGFLDEQ